MPGYLCASTAAWPQRGCGAAEMGCACEVRFPPEAGGIPVDGGKPSTDAGSPPDYCRDVKPILTVSCLGTCHGPQMGFVGAPPDFRLDYYTPPALPDGGLGLPGVKAKADRVQERIWIEKTMPPPPDMFLNQPTDAERSTVNRWVAAGALLGDGWCERDGGAPVSFASDVLPIFAGNCGCHTGASPAAGLSLTSGSAYLHLVNAAVSAGCANGPQQRVVGNAPAQSQLWLKLADDPNKCNAYMPRDAGMPLKTSNPAAFDKIDRWIRQGAPNN